MSMHRQNLGLVLAVVASCAAASLSFTSTGHAHDPMYPKIGFHFRLGVGGDIERVGSGTNPRAAMEPGFGGGVELEVPLSTHFSLGGAFEAYGWSVQGARGGYNVSLDLLFMPRFRIPFGAHPWHLEVYFGLPIGPTLSLPHDNFSGAVGTSGLGTGFGVTGGGRVGFRMNLDEVVGIFADVGPMLQFVSYSTPSSGPNFDLWHYQFVLRIGGSFGVGA